MEKYKVTREMLIDATFHFVGTHSYVVGRHAKRSVPGGIYGRAQIYGPVFLGLPGAARLISSRPNVFHNRCHFTPRLLRLIRDISRSASAFISAFVTWLRLRLFSQRLLHATIVQISATWCADCSHMVWYSPTAVMILSRPFMSPLAI